MLGLMDCTLRDGANVVGKGFDTEITRLVLKGLTENGIETIEFGNALGIGAYDAGNAQALTDEEYLSLARPYTDKAELGMFMGWKNGSEENILKARKAGLSFLRVGANAGDAKGAAEAVRCVKSAGLTCRYSFMKAYVLPPQELAAEAELLESSGADELTIMDSAGTMLPSDVTAYVEALKSKVSIPIAFHGHNNLGLATANALAAYAAGTDVIDCCLMGMARSAGNIALEQVVGLLQRKGELKSIDFYGLLAFLKDQLIPAMEKRNYHVPISPIDLVYGLSGTHSSFAPLFEAISNAYHVNIFKLVFATAKRDKKAPSRELIEETAKGLLSYAENG